tara:strand:- start:30712 stop:31455 length:744 start_codon:yes stop_codon:yes gene_type:complete
MTLVQSLVKQGNFFFRYRGQFPILLFILSVPFIYLTDYSNISEQIKSNVLLLAIVLSSLGFLIRFYTIGTTPLGTSGRNTKKQIADALNSTGIYSMVRHPLYLGNYIIWLGISISTFNIFFILIMSLLFWIYYERIMFAEEEFLKGKFSNTFIDWSNNIPAFIPSISSFKSSETSFSIVTVLRREYASVLSAVIGFVFVEFFRNYFSDNTWCVSALSQRILIITLVLVLLLRSLKHYTNLLQQKGRS